MQVIGEVVSVVWNNRLYDSSKWTLFSSSTDHSCRIWTLSGRYVGTLGSPINWEKLSPTEQPKDDYKFRIPPDIKRIASSTTLQVSVYFKPFMSSE